MDERLKNYYLAHHGIPGQKWGQRHGPPYPLNPNASKQASLKAKSKSKSKSKNKSKSKSNLGSIVELVLDGANLGMQMLTSGHFLETSNKILELYKDVIVDENYKLNPEALQALLVEKQEHKETEENKNK